jgi:CheY-like chemotaxis protein
MQGPSDSGVRPAVNWYASFEMSDARRTIRSVLVIDDTPDIRRVAELALRAVGKLEVFLAATGEEGVESAARHQPDVILLDVLMSGMDGPATLAALRAHPGTRAIPVVFLTAKSQDAERARYLALGAAGVIAKPFEVLGLAKELARIVGEAAPGA